MAKLTEQLAIVVGLQSAEGVVNTTVENATAIGTTEAGTTAVGVAFKDKSLTLDFERLEEAGQNVTGSLTKTAGTRLTDAVSFSFNTTLKGPGVANPANAGDFTLLDGLGMLLSGSGLQKGTETAISTSYVLGDPTFLTFKVWRGDQSFTLVDCKVSPTWNLNPGKSMELGIDVVVGSVIQNNADTFPTAIDFGTLTSLAAPPLKNAEAKIGANLRGQIDGSIKLDNTFQEAPDGNSITGIVQEISDRTVSYAGSFYADSSISDQDWQNLVRTSTPVDEISFTLGVQGGSVSNAFVFTLQNVNFTKVNYVDASNKIAWNLEGYATANAGAANSEFSVFSV